MTETEPTLRPAGPADSDAVRTLVSSVLAEFGLAPDPGSTDRDLADPAATYRQRGGRFDVLEQDGRIIGCVGMYPLDEPGSVELRKMYLEPGARGRGLGRRLLDHALAWARAAGYRRVTLETATVLVDAIALYESYGFRRYRPVQLSSRCDQAWSLDLGK